MYVKAELADGVEIKVELTDDNLYDTCANCGKEIVVCLEELVNPYMKKEDEEATVEAFMERLRYCGECGV